MRNLVAAIMKTGSGSIANLLFGMASVKIIAMLLGPSGVGLFSLIRQTMQTLAVVGLGGQTALVQGVASKDGADRDDYIRTTFWIFILGSALTSLLIVSLAPLLSFFLFGKNDPQLVSLVRWIALPVVLANTYIYFKSLLNGFRAIGRLALVEMLGPLVMLLIIYPAGLLVGKGYVLVFVWMLSVSQFLMMLSSLGVVYRNGWISFGLIRANIDKAASKYFFRIAGTTLLTALLSTGSILVVRAMVTKYGGLHEAGLFDLAWTLSGAYVMLLLGSFGTYYMPALSGTSDPSERLVLIRQVIRLSTLLMVPMIVCVISLKPLVVRIFYTSEFLPSLKLVQWMLIGDYFKITCWVLAIPAIAHAKMKVYFWTETFWYIGFMFLSALSIYGFGELQGIAMAFVALYACLLVFYLVYLRRVYGLRLTSDFVSLWLIGLVIVVMASWQTWDNSDVNWRVSLFFMAISCLFVWIMLKKEERKKMIMWLR